MRLVFTLSFCRSRSVVAGKTSPLNLSENKSHSFGVISSTPATLHTTATIKVCCAPEHVICKKKEKKKDILCLEKHQTNFNLILKEVIIFKIPRIIIIIFIIRAGNNFCLFTGHISFQIFLSLRQFTNWT